MQKTSKYLSFYRKLKYVYDCISHVVIRSREKSSSCHNYKVVLTGNHTQFTSILGKLNTWYNDVTNNTWIITFHSISVENGRNIKTNFDLTQWQKVGMQKFYLKHLNDFSQEMYLIIFKCFKRKMCIKWHIL